MPTVLVTDAGRGSAIAIMRSLGRAGWRVVAADADPASPGFRSRHVQERVSYPPPGSPPDAVVDALAHAAGRHDVDLLVPVTDDTLLPVSGARGRFPARCHLAVADPAAIAAVTDKDETVRLARRLGVPVPRTAVAAGTSEALRVAEELGWPVVLKPQASFALGADGAGQHFEVSYAGGPDELVRRMATFEGRTPVLVQELWEGEGHGVELLLHEGRPLAAFQHRRLREVPVTGGASALRESVALDPVLYRHAAALLGELRWTGLAMVEFKVGPRGACLMEINGRIWGSLPLAVRAGMDFPARLAALHLDGPPPPGPPDTTYEVGVRSRNLGLELAWIGSVLQGRRRHPFLAMPPRRAAIAAALRLPLPGDGHDVLSLDDPRPGFADAARVVRRLGKKVRHARS